MKRFLTLVRWEYNSLFWPLCAIAGTMAALQVTLFFIQSRGEDVIVPLSYLIEQSGVILIFILASIALVGLAGMRMVQNFMPSKSIYALLTLPGARRNVYLARLVAFLLAVAVLIAVQMAVLLLIGQTGFWPEIGHWSRRGADLYLAMLEIPLLRILFPQGFFPRLISIAAILGTVSVALYVSVAVKSKKIIAPLVSSGIWILLIIRIFPLSDMTLGTVGMFFAFMLLVTVVTTRMGIELYESGEVAE